MTPVIFAKTKRHRLLNVPLGGTEGPALGFPGLPNAWSDTVVPNRRQHILEDFSTYSVIGDFGVNNRTDGHAPWSTISSRLSLETSNLSPWFSGKVLVSTLETGAGALGVNCGFQEPAGGGLYHNFSSPGQGLVYQYAIQCANGVLFEGKQFDFGNFTNSITYRWTDESYDVFRIGDSVNSNCDTDTLCSTFYSNNGASAIQPDEPSNVNIKGWLGFVSSNRSSPAVGANFIKQNKTASQSGIPSYLTDGTWGLRTWKITMGHGYGNGRVQMFHTLPNGTTYEIMRYIGDVGQLCAGKIDTPNIDQGEFFVRSSDGFGTLHVFQPSRADNGGGWNGGSTMRLGGLVCFTYDPVAL